MGVYLKDIYLRMNNDLKKVNVQTIKKVVDKEDVSSIQKMRMACAAALNDCWDMVKRIINQYIPEVATNDISRSENKFIHIGEVILIIAKEKGYLNIIKYLVGKRPDIFYCVDNAAASAVQLGSLDTLKYFVEER